jgi:hypothetical protein
MRLDGCASFFSGFRVLLRSPGTTKENAVPLRRKIRDPNIPRRHRRL